MKRFTTGHPALRALSLLFLFSCFTATSAQAANKYVRAGATGAANGSDWTNAYTSLPKTLTRGDTYYIANGTYGNYTFNTATSGSTLITIKKATIADHGTSTGWSDAFGDGQALFATTANLTAAWYFATSYWLVDGQTGGGPGSWTSGFGFKVQRGTGESVIVIGNLLGNTPSYITLRHVEAQGGGPDGAGGQDPNDIFGIYTAGSSDITVSYAYFYDAGRGIFFNRGSNITFEYIYTGYYESTPEQHAAMAPIWSTQPQEPRPSNVTFRYNIFTHVEGTGGLIMDGDGLYVYGNMFYRPTRDTWDQGNGIIGTWKVNTLTQTKVHNNTFVNVGTSPVFGQAFTNPTTGNEAYNNLHYNTGNYGGLGTLFPTYDYNHYVDTTSPTETNKTTGTGDPFVNYVGLDFRLRAATAAGMTLAPPYDRDMLGNLRGSDGTWDRGAIEFGGAIMPKAPTNLSVQ